MAPRQITHKSVFRVLAVGFGLVIALLLGAALFGLRNIQSIQASAAQLAREESVTQRLIQELRDQQTSVREVFSLLARDPDSVDSAAILKQIQDAQDDIARISAQGLQTPERALWERLRERSVQFSNEARRLVMADNPQSFASFDLFRYHESFTAIVSSLIEREYQKVSAAQAQIDLRSVRLLRASAIFAGAAILLAIAFALITLTLASRLIRQMEWQTAELARVSWHMLEDQEAAARRFSHELHDELGQSLTAIKTNLTALGSGNGAGATRLEDCLGLVDEAIGNVRQLSQLLRPTILDDFGLEAGLRWLCDGFSARTGIDVHLESNQPGRLPDETETHLFRIAQEALTNVARHSAAKNVWISLAARDGAITLSVRDDGRGMDVSAAGGMGLVGMRARARSAGGDLDVRSRPAAGVQIEVQLPFRHETHSHIAG